MRKIFERNFLTGKSVDREIAKKQGSAGLVLDNLRLHL